MSNNTNEKILLVGAGGMAREYAKVLQALNRDFVVVGRGEESAQKFYEATGISVFTGGIEKYLTEHESDLPDTAIVAVRAVQLADVTENILDAGIKRLLVEKPGAYTEERILRIKNKADRYNAEVAIAFNRRYFSSVLEARKMIEEDGGVTSFYFEFTEWPASILRVPVEAERQGILVGNSSHVIDMAFYLGGKPKEMSSYKIGSLEWHNLAASFAGAGITENGATFAYQANYDAPGRWGVEVMTRKHRYIFRPLEKLQIQNMNSVKIEFAEIDDHLDVEYKPGVYRETEDFLTKDMKDTQLCSLNEQCWDFKNIYNKIAGIK